MKSLRKIFALLLCLSLCLKFAPSIHADSERSFQNNSEEVIIDHNTSGLFSPRTGGVSSSFLNECSSSYKSGPYYSKLANLSLSGNPASDLILVAYSQIGYHEGTSWDEISGTYNGCSDYTEYNRWYPVQAQWWCNLFVSWCFRAAGIGDDIAPKNPFYLSQWRSRGAGVFSWGDYKNGFITPQPGDIIIYGPDSSDVDGSSLEDSYQHIGIVYSYQNGTFFNIEGNYSDAVTFVDHTPDYYSGWSGTGFIHAIVRPNYGPITYLDKCNVYPTNITVKTNVNVNLKSLPCSQDTDPNSTTLTQIPSGKSFTVTELYRNDYDHYDKCWYKVSYDGKEGYIYSGHTVVTEYGDNTVSVSGGTSAPTTLPENQGYFATWLINSNHLWIDTVRGYIFDRNTGAVIPGYPSEKTGIRAMSYQLGSENRNEPVDAGLHFSTLSPGDYFCIIEVTTHCYYGASDGSLQTKATDYHPIDFSFKKEGSANLSSGAGRPIPDGTYIIASYADPQYYIDIEGSGYPAENGANVGLWGPRDGTLPEYDTWTVTYINDGNGFYFITQPNTEMALSACGSTTKSGDNIAVYPFRQLDAQKWSIVQNENGSYSIRAKCSGNCIDISGKISETCNIQQWEANYGVYQQWIFIPNGDLESYTVSYNANGGTDAPANQVKLYNIDLILSSDQPKRADTSAESFIVTLDANDGSGSSTSLTAERTTKYTFKNWKANDSDRSYGAGDIYKTNAPVTLNAQWDSSTETAAVILPAPTRDGYVFRGWATTSTAPNPQYGAGDSFIPDGDVTLYAVWEEGTLTDWSETRPEGVDESLIESKTQYRYRVKETASGTEPAMDGWTPEGSEQIWGEYGPWSDWDTDAVSASDDCQVETAALYRYYYYLCPHCGRHEPLTGWSDCGLYELSDDDWHETWSTIPYSACSYGTFSYTTAKYYTTSLGDGQEWCFSSGNLYDTAIGTYDTTSDDIIIKQGYRYRTRTLETQYTFYRWTDWSSWSDVEAIAGDAHEVETRTLYRYIAKDHTVTYDANGGTGAPDPQIKVHGEALTLSDTIPNRDGYVFLGWAADQTATEAEYQPSDSFTTDADTTLYAVWEYDVVASGVWGDLDWVIGRDGTLTISGSGPMDTGAYLGSDNWTDHKNLFTKVVIQEGVTSVGDLAFTMGFNITQVSLPDSLTRIGAGAFLSCKNLTEIVIPEHVTSIDQGAFGSSGLTKVVIPASVVSIGEQAFLDNILDSVTFEGHAPEIGENAFKNVEATVYFPADDVSWSESMRQNYKGTLSWVAYTADGHRYGAPDWSWANDYESASATFTYLDNNSTQTLTETVTSTQIEPSCTVDGDLVYTASVTFNGQNYTDRRSVAQPDFVLPDALTEIGEEAFANCAFTYVKLSENTDTIGKNAFANCRNLKYIYIPVKNATIDSNAFYGVAGLTVLGVSGGNVERFASGKGFDFIAVS